MILNTACSDGFTIGLGLTDRCNSNCPHCYSRPENGCHDMDYSQVTALFDKILVKSVNYGTGESILYPDFRKLIFEVKARNITQAVTTNGFTIDSLSDEELLLFHDVDFSLDYPVKELNDSWRGEGSFDMVKDNAVRCIELGVEASIVTCLMKNNHAYMGDMVRLAAEWGLNLRVNVYKPVRTDKYKPDYHEFWRAVSDMAEAGYFIACSEPIVNAAIGNPNAKNGNPCGKNSFRVHPDGKIVPCVYLNHSDIYLSQVINGDADLLYNLGKKLELPLNKECSDCDFKNICHGGCASRRIYHNHDKPDEYCFIHRDDKPVIKAKWKTSKGLVHEDYLCTMIFSG
ncbi:radical SAM protein [bacterium]|nr:radical SAM protein [bacterium]